MTKIIDKTLLISFFSLITSLSCAPKLPNNSCPSILQFYSTAFGENRTDRLMAWPNFIYFNADSTIRVYPDSLRRGREFMWYRYSSRDLCNWNAAEGTGSIHFTGVAPGGPGKIFKVKMQLEYNSTAKFFNVDYDDDDHRVFMLK